MSKRTPTMRRRLVQRKVGQALALWCGAFGALHLLWIQSFTATIVPSVPGLDIPEAPVIVFSFAFGIFLFFVAGLAGNLSDDKPSVIIGKHAVIKRALLLVLSLAALVRVGLGFVWFVVGELSVLGLIAELWFLVAGTAGIVLWVTLLRRKQDIQRRA